MIFGFSFDTFTYPREAAQQQNLLDL